MHFTAGLSALSLLTLPVLSAPTPTMKGISRAEKVIDTLEKLIDLIDGMPTVYDAWDYENVPGACSVQMYTHGGGNCKVTVECADDYKAVYENFHVCYVGGEEFLTDKAIGEFSVKWTGVEHETMGYPELRISSVDDGTAWDVPALTKEGKNTRSDAPARVCNDKPDNFTFDGPFGPNLQGECIYECGVPQLGSAGPSGVRNMLPTNDRGYAGGWCGMHATQYQKPDPSRDQYKFDVTLFDENEQEIGNVRDAVAGTLQAKEPIGVTSRLPWVLIVDAGNVDDDAVLFRYGDQSWGSNDQEHHCNFGSYDNEKREGDCGFSC